MTHLHNYLQRLFEYWLGLLFWVSVAALIWFALSFVPALAHPDQIAERRIAEDRYFCYSDQTKLYQIYQLLHARGMETESELVAAIHQTLEIHLHCRSLRK